MGAGRVRRVKGWELRLVAAMDAETGRAFDWSSAHCGHLMAASVLACRGELTPGVKAMLTPATERGVKAMLARHGGLTKALQGEFETQPNRLMLHNGDIGVVIENDTECGVVILDGVAVGRSETGLFRVPVSRVVAGFLV